jgi:hypothetical protein
MGLYSVMEEIILVPHLTLFGPLRQVCQYAEQLGKFVRNGGKNEDLHHHRRGWLRNKKGLEGRNTAK